VSARCQATGRTVGFGNSVSHSHRRTRRRVGHQIFSSRGTTCRQRIAASLYRISTKGIKVIDRAALPWNHAALA
jgi:large subunit ribosomal protein L28